MSIAFGRILHKDDHYRRLAPQPLEVIDDWQLGYKAGNVIKYIARAPYKNQEQDDYRKALEYLRCLRDEAEEYERLMDNLAIESITKWPLDLVLREWQVPSELQACIGAIYWPEWKNLYAAITAMEEWLKKY